MRKNVTIFGLILAVIFIAVGLWLAFGASINFNLGNDQQEENQSDQSSGISIAKVAGKILIQTPDGNWQPAQTGIKINLAPGNKIKTEDSIAAIELSDGNTLSLAAKTEIKIDSIDQHNLQLTLNQGRIYSQIKKGADTIWKVKALSTIAQADQGSFAVSIPGEKDKLILDVVENYIKLTLIKDNSSIEHKIMYGTHLELDLSKSLDQALPLEELTQEQIKADELLTLEIQDIEKNGEAEAEAEDPSASIKLTGIATESGIYLSWSLKNTKAPFGFQVIKSTNPEPNYNQDESHYLELPETRTHTWVINDGQTYYFRLCTWDAGKEACEVVSNTIELTTIRDTETTFEYTKSELQLTIDDSTGTVLNWSASNAANFKGYKIVRSATDEDLFYPKNDALTYIVDREV
jgi:hypothetical protein